MEYGDAILDKREETHGDWPMTAHISQTLKDVIASSGNADLRTPMESEALDMIATKIARIVSGDSSCKEHWDDIAGYAKLVSAHLSSTNPEG